RGAGHVGADPVAIRYLLRLVAHQGDEVLGLLVNGAGRGGDVHYRHVADEMLRGRRDSGHARELHEVAPKVVRDLLLLPAVQLRRVHYDRQLAVEAGPEGVREDVVRATLGGRGRLRAAVRQ